jgi:Holliday junction resolvase
MTGRASRDKGARMERSIVHILQDAGLAAERVPLSGAAGGSYVGDVSCPVLGEDWVFECKSRAAGFAQLYGWLGEHKGLVVKADRQEPLMVMRLSDFLRVLMVAEGRK